MLATHTLNEVRAKLYGLESVPNGDSVAGTQQPVQPLLPQFGMTLEADELSTTEIDPNEKNIQQFTILQKSVGNWFEETDKQVEDGVNNSIPGMIKLVLRTFAKQADAVADVLLALKSEIDYEKKELPPKKELRRKITKALDELEEQYVDGYAPNLSSVVELGYGATFAISFNEEDKLALDAIRELNEKKRRAILSERGLETFAWINKATTDRIMQTIEDGMAAKRSIYDITKQIVEDFSDIENIGRRAEVIARTEVLTASSIGQAAALKDAEKVIGPMLKMWVNAGDERVRGPGGIYPKSEFNHRINGEVRKTNEKFSTGLMYPREPGGEPGNVIQCRCRIVAVAVEDAEALGLGKIDVQEDN